MPAVQRLPKGACCRRVFPRIGCALTAVQLLPHGVYIAMNGRVFGWDRVRKNRELGVFEEKRG